MGPSVRGSFTHRGAHRSFAEGRAAGRAGVGCLVVIAFRVRPHARDALPGNSETLGGFLAHRFLRAIWQYGQVAAKVLITFGCIGQE